MKKPIIRIQFFMMALILVAAFAYATVPLDYPHSITNNVDCEDCHYTAATDFLNPAWIHDPQANIDDTPFNNFCWSCHNDNTAPYVNTHSSLSTSSRFDPWEIECRTCHWPHHIMQYRIYGAESYIESGQSTLVDATSLTLTGAGWTINEFAGLVVIPNINNDNYNYKISNNTEDTITVTGTIDLNEVTAGDTFAVVYKNIVRSSITTPNSGDKTVKFFDSAGANSFADGDSTYDGVCEVCHTLTDHFRNDGTGDDPLHTNMGSPAGTDCTVCHMHKNGFRGMGDGAHDTHVLNEYGPKITCEGNNLGCHGSYAIPLMADGLDLANTTVCDECHSSDGAVVAKQYWETSGSSLGSDDTWRVVEGDESYCGSCHDDTPGTINSNSAPNIAGDKTTYGFFVTGHGRTAEKGVYAKLSWQDSAANGNPAASRGCGDCHELTSIHIGNGDSRLKTGYENDEFNTNCNNCHAPGGMATADPQYYTSSGDFELSAHGDNSKLNPLTSSLILCTDCHDVHGAAGTYAAMTTADQESLCFDCHKDPMQGGIENLAISGSDVADDIEEAFSYADADKHNMGASYRIGSSNYTLECVTCHNVHLITGKYLEADQAKSPITLVSTPSNPQGNLQVWGDDAGEKMDTYGGTYRTPSGDPFSGSELPNYATFCLDCHEPMPDPSEESGAHGNIGWSSDPHGLQSANNPNGYGVCPNWYGCGKAAGWDNDDCISDQDTCWPVITRGKGDQLFSRNPYYHEERIAGANFALSCTDCHEAHGSGEVSMLRTNPNNGTGSWIWNTMCNNCHYYYSDWHAGMSCGPSSCHVSSRMGQTGTATIHRMGAATGTSMTRSFNPDLVLHYAFENNLKDSGDWQMDGKWMDNIAGSYATGKYGKATVLSGGMNVQVGTENEYWSTDAGRHGTHIYTDMKYNTTLEAWVYPTDDNNSEYSIFTKHVGYSQGGYGFALKMVGSTLRAAFNMQADNNAGDQGGANGVRGAYSSVAIPLNTWSHVAATFDTAGADRDDNDPTVGRIRIYVNGEDVTTSDSSGNFMQPGAGETSIYAYVENSPWNESICYAGHWCASEFSIGGFYGWQNEFIGRLDEARVWNITKDAAYFAPIDGMVAPMIVSVTVYTPDQLLVSFSEGVFGSGASSELVPADFILNCSGRTILSVIHTAGDPTAILVLSSDLDPGDIGVCTLASSGSIIDDYSLSAGTDPVIITGSLCPELAVFSFSEPACSTTAQDDAGFLTGTVSDSCSTFTGDGYFHGDGDGANNNYIDYFDSDACMHSGTALTIEARIKPTGIGTSNYIRRLFAKDQGGVNYQISVWRNNNWAEYNAPDGTASIALWTPLVDTHGGDVWKVLKTDYNSCPIVSDHWYETKIVWNSAKTGGIPGDIFVDDQGTDGNDADENWTGYINCTDSAQTQTKSSKYYYEGDEIKDGENNLRIGANVNNSTKHHFNGLIDWIKVQTAVDYSGVDDTPNPPQP